MTLLTQPLRDEHKELFPHVDRIRNVADEVSESPATEIRRRVDEVYDFLANHLRPHAHAEEQALYPVVQKALGSPAATQTMTRDHVEIGRYIDELADIRVGMSHGNFSVDEEKNLRRVLYGVYALVKVHFAKEEEVYLPILDQYLTPERADEMFTAMEAAAHDAKHTAHVH